MWLIDQTELTLYRYVAGDMEQVIPIKDNDDIKSFVCMSQDEYSGILQYVIGIRRP